MNRRTITTKGLDWTAVTIYLILVVFAWFNLYSASFEEGKTFFQLKSGQQLIWMMISFFMIIVIMLVDNKFFYFSAYFIYLFVIILLLSVLILGVQVHGARSWFALGSIRFQPAELAKLSVSLALAKFLSSFEHGNMNFKIITQSLLIIFLPSIFILMQPDPGTAIIFISFVLVLYKEGLPFQILLIGFLFILLFIFSIIIKIEIIFLILLLISAIIYFVSRKNNISLHSF